MMMRGDDRPDDRRHGFRFIPTLSWDSVAMVAGVAFSGFMYVQTIKSDQRDLAKDVQQQAKDIANIQKSVDRLETTAEKQVKRVEDQTKERADRLEAIVKEQNKIVQDALAQLRK